MWAEGLCWISFCASFAEMKWTQMEGVFFNFCSSIKDGASTYLSWTWASVADWVSLGMYYFQSWLNRQNSRQKTCTTFIGITHGQQVSTISYCWTTKQNGKRTIEPLMSIYHLPRPSDGQNDNNAIESNIFPQHDTQSGSFGSLSCCKNWLWSDETQLSATLPKFS